MMITIINSIVRTTEKAILVSVNVSFNCNRPKAREIWMPKSVVKILGENILEIADWFARKLSQQNAFHGYEMQFADEAYINA